MDVIATIQDFRRARGRFGRLGFVPTMGYLHDGHLSLVRQARAECGAVAASIFVNPTQFAPHEDFSRYPRDMERDLALLRDLGTDLVFTPGVAEMYPPGSVTAVEVSEVSERLEGAVRPGHFRGVATVVCKLFNIVQPTRAYFGQKDAQQTVVIRRMVRDLAMPLEVVVCPTVREPDGLAMSSRNVYLAPEERRAAAVLYRALRQAEAAYRGGERAAASLRRIMRDTLAGEPLAEIEYVSVAHPDSLAELDAVIDGALLSLAVRIGRTRLIDNIPLPPDPPD
ncbi:MAG TPA: pantoate--beta-alanine ligase [Ferrovibrio sp.]|uniref:pantoate--beta-alanine ligase n=1 Tax=Ferrovibrio sp. TaxID=1917215 RepID=UPI002ED3B0D0